MGSTELAVLSMEPLDEIPVLARRSYSSLSLCPMKTQRREGYLQARKRAFTEVNLPTLSSWTSQAPELRKIDVCHYGILL